MQTVSDYIRPQKTPSHFLRPIEGKVISSYGPKEKAFIMMGLEGGNHNHSNLILQRRPKDSLVLLLNLLFLLQRWKQDIILLLFSFLTIPIKIKIRAWKISGGK